MLRAVFILLNQKYYVSTIALRTWQQNPQGAHRSAGNTGGQATDRVLTLWWVREHRESAQAVTAATLSTEWLLRRPSPNKCPTTASKLHTNGESTHLTAVGTAQLLLQEHLTLNNNWFQNLQMAWPSSKHSVDSESYKLLWGNTLTCGFNVLNTSFNKNGDRLLWSHNSC